MGTRIIGKGLCKLTLAISAAIFLTNHASGQIFVESTGWATQPYLGGSIGEYDLSGNALNPSLVTGITPAASDGLAISGTNIYVANENSYNIGIYSTSGSTVGTVTNYGVLAVATSGSNLFALSGNGLISEYDLAGNLINSSLISNVSNPASIAVSGSDIFVGEYGKIAEYTTSGGTITTDLISPTNGNIAGIAVSGSDLFFSGYNIGGNDAIEEYTTTGTLVNADLISGAFQGLTVSGTNLYATSFGNGQPNGGTVGEYTTTGTVVNASLITGLNAPTGIAVEVSTPEPSTWALLSAGVALIGINRFRKYPLKAKTAPTRR